MFEVSKATGIIGHWPLNGNSVALPNARDISRFGNDGTMTDVSLTTGIHGEADGACLFNGTTSKIDSGKDMIGIKPLTIEVWIYLNGWGESTNGRIVDNGKTLFWVAGAFEVLYFRSDGATSVRSDDGSIVLSTWTHACVTRTLAGVTNFYINGVLSGGADRDSGVPAVGASNVFIGNISDGDRTFDGKIAKLKLRSYVMSAGQVSNLYQSYGV